MQIRTWMPSFTRFVSHRKRSGRWFRSCGRFRGKQGRGSREMKTARFILGAAMAVLCPAGSAQNVSAIAAIDPFIGAIETMKRSVVPLVCVAMNGTRPKILQRTGTAFFVSGAGDFVTAAHVILT